MEIDEKQFLNDEWYNKYSASLALATIVVLKQKDIAVEQYLDDLIQFSQDPIKADITNLCKLSKEPERGVAEIMALALALKTVKRITIGGQNREYFNLAKTGARFHAVFHIGDNLRNNIQIMEHILGVHLYGSF